MSATIEVNRVRATLDGWEWKSNDETLEQLLNTMLSPDGPSGADPDPEYHAAKAAADELGGEVISSDPVEDEPGLVN